MQLKRSFIAPLTFALALSSGGCGAPAASQVCPPPEARPGNDELTARKLDPLKDSDDAWKSEPARIDDCYKRETYRFHGDDTEQPLGPKNDPSVQSTSPDLHFCVYVACDVGATHVYACNGDHPFYAKSELGTRGCCSSGKDSVSVDYFCEDSSSAVISHDSADIFVQLCPSHPVPASSLQDVRFEYHF